MFGGISIKLILSLASTVITVIGFYPYFRDIFLKKTTPHLYTWLIWVITQGTAAAASWKGGGNYALISSISGAVLVLLIFLLTFKYGTKNITKSDTVVLIIALLAILIWWKLNQPIIAVFMVSAIDGLGYIPTFRKAYEEPHSETVFFWAMMVIACVLVILASGEYNLLTVTYYATLAVANTAVCAVCLLRRRVIASRDAV